MRVLFLSNFYPPHHIGGYGMLCLEVVEGLERRGHATRVLTSAYGLDAPADDGAVRRALALESELDYYSPRDALEAPRRRADNIRCLHDEIEGWKPDLIYIWGMWNLGKALAAAAEARIPGRVAYYIANPWPIQPNHHVAYWDTPARGRARSWLKRLVRLPIRLWLAEEWSSPQLRLEHTHTCSVGQRDQLLAAGVVLPGDRILYEGIALGPYLAQADQRAPAQPDGRLELVYVGILSEHKGVHTAIEALARLDPAERARVGLTILGRGHPDYTRRLHALVEAEVLSEQVHFESPIPREALPAYLGRFDVLLMPSIWAEPLARIMQEALASGMVFVGTNTGGTPEIVTNDENGLLFEPEDAGGLAAHIERLLTDPAARDRMGRAGRRTAEARFDIGRMVDEIEVQLDALLQTAESTI